MHAQGLVHDLETKLSHAQNDESHRDGSYATTTPRPVLSVPAPRLAQAPAPATMIAPTPAPAPVPAHTPALASGPVRVAATVAKIGAMTQRLKSARTPAAAAVAAPVARAAQGRAGHGDGGSRRSVEGAQARGAPRRDKPRAGPRASTQTRAPTTTPQARAPPHAQDGVNLSIFRSSAFKKRAHSTSQGSSTRWGGTKRW